MRIGTVAALALTLVATSPARAADDPQARAKAFLAGLHPTGGDVRIAAAAATLHLGTSYYFLGAADAKRVLTEAWGNPADSVDDVLGMVLPAGRTVLDEGWGAVVTYQPSGYVSDKDAKTADYDEALTQLRGDEGAMNEERRKQGFPAQHLVGWAQAPTYDPVHHSMVWARDVAFAGQKADTLNYDVRLLGRAGVLSLNMVSSMTQLAETRAAAAAFGQTAAFDAGAGYADYRSGDKTADYGLAGLVAAGVGVAAAKKLGLLAIMLGFGKKFVLLIVAAAATLGGRLRRMFGRTREGDA